MKWMYLSSLFKDNSDFLLFFLVTFSFLERVFAVDGTSGFFATKTLLPWRADICCLFLSRVSESCGFPHLVPSEKCSYFSTIGISTVQIVFLRKKTHGGRDLIFRSTVVHMRRSMDGVQIKLPHSRDKKKKMDHCPVITWKRCYK